MATITEIAGPQSARTPASQADHDIEKIGAAPNATDVYDEKPEADDDSSQHKQHGVKKVEAITSVWTSKMLWLTFALIYLVSFVDMLLQAVQGELTAYVTSAFKHHGLLSTTSVISSILGGVSRLTIAKMIDIWGRVQGFIVMTLLIIIGMIMKATCQNVETYAAAQTIYWVGHLGLIYVIEVTLSDMTSLRNRMIILGINSTPTIATTFAGPKIAEEFYQNVNFRWAFGAFAIILFGFCIPLAIVFEINDIKAKKFGLAPKRATDRTWWESLKYYVVEFDLLGIILTTAGFALILLPFSLAKSFPKGWASAGPIVMIVMGVVSLALFVIWEKYFAPVSYLPFKFLKDRTILGASMTYGVMFISIYCWDTYYSSYLQVVHNQSISHSGYILNSYSLTSSFISPFIGLLIRYMGHFKYTAYAGIPFIVLGTALLIEFRTPHSKVGYLVMCQIFNGLSGGIFAISSQLAVMSAASHQEIAVVLAIYGLFGSIGAAIGLAVSGAMWTNILLSQLEKRLPDDSKNLAQSIYGSLPKQLSYPMGSPIREAIIAAYSDVQRKMVIAGACFIPLLVACILVWRNLNVKKLEQSRKQTKGNVW